MQGLAQGKSNGSISVRWSTPDCWCDGPCDRRLVIGNTTPKNQPLVCGSSNSHAKPYYFRQVLLHLQWKAHQSDPCTVWWGMLPIYQPWLSHPLLDEPPCRWLISDLAFIFSTSFMWRRQMHHWPFSLPSPLLLLVLLNHLDGVGCGPEPKNTVINTLFRWLISDMDLD